MVCRKCKKIYSDGYSYCPRCGNKLKSIEDIASNSSEREIEEIVNNYDLSLDEQEIKELLEEAIKGEKKTYKYTFFLGFIVDVIILTLVAFIFIFITNAVLNTDSTSTLESETNNSNYVSVFD